MNYLVINNITPRLTAWITIFFQLSTLMFGSYSLTVSAAINGSPAKSKEALVNNLPDLSGNQSKNIFFSNPNADEKFDARKDNLNNINIKKTDSESEKQFAGYVSRAGTFLGESPNGEAASNVARGVIMGKATAEIQDWLSPLGTARIQMGADKNFSLKNSQLDLLIPLQENRDSLFFSQGSIHRTDTRSQVNLGLGFRYFNDGWMLGANTFLDHDISRGHSRLGIGAEYWRDFLKLGANSYQRLTGWKNSPDLVDYEERPANGWDFRVQGWVPALPQLGARLTYEQYYGKEVALSGADKRQREPQAVTAGVSYTPVPLVTLNAEHRQSNAESNDARFGVDVTYQFGVPMNHQIDPSAVSAMRTLAGSRLDLVERNNNIVLEYRKKEVIKLNTARLITGYAGEKKSLNVSLNAKYALKGIEWHAPALIAAGGQIVEDNPGTFSVLMPRFQNQSQAVNTYTVSGVAVDVKDNRSGPSETQITVLAPAVHAGNSTFLPASSVHPADGKTTQVLTLSLKDNNNQPVDVSAADIALGKAKSPSASFSDWTRKEAGVYEISVQAGLEDEKYVLAPVIHGIALASATVSFESTAASLANSSINTDRTRYKAGEDITVSVTLKDAKGSPVNDAQNQLSQQRFPWQTPRQRIVAHGPQPAMTPYLHLCGTDDRE